MDRDPQLPIIRALDLRSLLVLILLGHQQPVGIDALVDAVGRAGFALHGRPGKAVSDALRWEVKRGRARQEGRGKYLAGYVAKTTRGRMQARVAQTRTRGGTPAYRDLLEASSRAKRSAAS